MDSRREREMDEAPIWWVEWTHDGSLFSSQPDTKAEAEAKINTLEEEGIEDAELCHSNPFEN